MKTNDDDLAMKRRHLRIYRERMQTTRDAVNRDFYRNMIDDLESDIAVAELMQEIDESTRHHYHLEFDNQDRAVHAIRDPDAIIHKVDIIYRVKGWLWWRRKVKIWVIKVS